METFQELKQSILNCQKCPRLLRHCQDIAHIRKREFRDWEYWGKPVPGFGDPDAVLWIVGLAPAAHGANRTGRMFTGDSSGNWLYKALYQTGFANQERAVSSSDGLTLTGAFISAACRCAPPDNKPTREELSACEPYLTQEFALLRRRKLTLALGAIALDSLWRVLKNSMQAKGPKPKFGHGATYEIGGERILCSYHPSRQNTQTHRLTPQMWKEIFELARKSCHE